MTILETSLRFAVLLHESPEGNASAAHWDILLEPAAGAETLLTWSIPPQPLEGRILPFFQARGARLPDHRRLYLEYEGPVSGNRGHVRRLDAGVYESCGTNRFRLAGTLFNGLLDVSVLQNDNAVELLYRPGKIIE